MKIHTTNYKNTFIEVAEDSPAFAGEVPPVKKETPSVANIQFDMISRNPYKYTSDEVLFQVYAQRNNIEKAALAEVREAFFSKGQPCLRASPLTKRYGWGVHCNEEEKIAVYGCETAAYKAFSKDKKLKVVKAMRSSR